MITVSDTTAITTLLKVGWENLLPALFGRVLIPTAVAQELLQHHGATPSSDRARRVARKADPVRQGLPRFA